MEKTLIVFACLVGFALAQSGQTYSRYQSRPQPPAKEIQAPPARRTQSSHSGQSAYSAQSGQSAYSAQSGQSAYSAQSGQSAYSAQSSHSAQSGCQELNERYAVPGSCDSYVECINGTATEKQCPDGLRFNPNVHITSYPCQYPNEVTCLERAALQPAQPTDQCPHQFGYFRIGDEKNCSYFRTCVNGVGYDLSCPEGLAWSANTYRCEWPDEVEDCDVEAFLGFRCPDVPESPELGPPAGYRFYRSDYDCQKYFLCIENRPRVLSCGSDTGFDELTSTCVSADEVENCPPELREAAARAREDEKQRFIKETEFNARIQAGFSPKKRYY